jgi:hypothetical protein
MFRSRRSRQWREVSISPLLTHCPGCESDLIQIECLHALAHEATLVERRCPECGHSEESEFTTAVADALCHRAAELAESLGELADRLESDGELWISEPLR